MKSIVNDQLASMGRKGDTMIAHINPREAAILKALGGRGGINPYTGFLEFWDDGGDESSSASTDTGPDTSGGFGGDESSSPGTDTGPDTSMGFGPAGDPTGVYGMMEGVKGLNPVGDVLGDLGGVGKAGMIGYGLAGLPGAAIGALGYGLYSGITGGWASLSPAQQDEAIATANAAMPDRGGDGGGGDYGITVAPEATFSATGTQPSNRRMIIDNLTNRFNRGVVQSV